MKKYLEIAWKWIVNKSTVIIVCCLIIVYLLAQSAVFQKETEKRTEEFQCQTSCFPQQNEYIYSGKVGSCWCYVDKSTLKKYNKE